MLSRTAESMFWMSRYMERAENTARFLDVNFLLLLDLDKIAEVEDSRSYWEALILATDDRERFLESYHDFTAEAVSEFLVFDRNNPNSIFSCIALARENARSVIEIIASEMWEQINRLYHYLNNADSQVLQKEPYNFYKRIKNGSHLFQGITDAIFSRSEAWDFVQAGRYLERADNTSRLVDVKYHFLVPSNQETHDSVDTIQWMAVLKSCSALEAFRKVYMWRIDPLTVVQYLVLDRHFPRSIYFCVAMLQESLWHISGSNHREYNNNADRLVGKLESELNYTTIEDIYQPGLHNWLEDLQTKLGQIGEHVHQTYFSYQAPSQQDKPVPLHPSNTRFVTNGKAGRAVWSQVDQSQQQQQQQQQ
jgi:uncharacterized alpha-E superfamily protein